MRLMLMAGLLAFGLACAGFILTQGDPGVGPAVAVASEAGPDLALRTREPSAERAESLLEKLIALATTRGDEAAVPEPELENGVYYQYVDTTGSVHFVQGKDEIPLAFRDGAGRVRVETPNIVRADPVGRPARHPYALPASPSVVVYTTSWCGWCRKTLAWLDAQGVAYENRDIESDDRYRAELIEKTGRTTIPVVEIDGQLVRGYDPSGMQQLLDG